MVCACDDARLLVSLSTTVTDAIRQPSPHSRSIKTGLYSPVGESNTIANQVDYQAVCLFGVLTLACTSTHLSVSDADG